MVLLFRGRAADMARERIGDGPRPGAGADCPTLRIDFPDDKTMRISHEAIYQTLFVQRRGVLRRQLTARLRTGRVLRVPRARVRDPALENAGRGT